MLDFIRLTRAPRPAPALSPRESRAVGAYIGLAVGDALGATVEFMTPREIQQRHGVHQEIQGGGWLRLKPGAVTDDTEMSLALGGAILKCNGVEATAIADAFSEWMRGKPVDIGHTVRRGIVQYRRTGLTETPENEHDAGNGACMRALPIALATLEHSEEAMVAAARIQAHVTHHNALSDAGSECVLRMVRAAILEQADLGGLASLRDRLIATHPPFRAPKTPLENPSGFIVDTLRVVFHALFGGSDFEGGMIEVVNRGGDADTTGAIYGMIAGALYGLEGIPQRWRRALQPEVYAACEAQALALLRLGQSHR